MNGRLLREIKYSHAVSSAQINGGNALWLEKLITVILTSTATAAHSMASLFQQARYWYPSASIFMIWKKTDYIDANCTTIHLGEFRYEIGFMPIDEILYASYMKGFWDEINEDMEQRREGRCVIGKNPDGTKKLCPSTRRCTGCPNKGLLERHNPKRVEILSLDYEYDGETFEIEDTSQPSVEDQVLDKLCPAPTEEELQIQLLAHFDRENPRYAQDHSSKPAGNVH